VFHNPANHGKIKGIRPRRLLLTSIEETAAECESFFQSNVTQFFRMKGKSKEEGGRKKKSV